MRWPFLHANQAWQRRDITRATLRLFVVGQPESEPGNFNRVYWMNSLYPRDGVLWTESGATWIDRSVTTEWWEPGARRLNWDFLRDNTTQPPGAPPTPRLGYPVFSGPGWVDVEIWPQIIERWIDHPDQNWGIIISASTNTMVNVRLASSEWADVGYRPQLILEIGGYR